MPYRCPPEFRRKVLDLIAAGRSVAAQVIAVDTTRRLTRFTRRFFDWHNNQHRHSGIGYDTPVDVHYGRAVAIQAQRAEVLDAAYQAHPERSVHQPPTRPPLPQTAWINKPEEDTTTQ